ncbi:MAG: SsrA-binding protein SmpB [Clostridia bacterium]|nr:SsrA-binding protein SmpB [Clostridia bacterium]
MKNDNIIATNKKAYHEYFIEDTYEAGIVLVGSEVKAVRMHNVSFVDSYVRIDGYTTTLVNLHITPYEKGSHYNVPAKRPRQLLLHRKEINKLKALVEKKGYTLVPTKIYFKQSLLKIEIGVAKGKHTYDKRQASLEKDMERDSYRQLKYEKYD